MRANISKLARCVCATKNSAPTRPVIPPSAPMINTANPGRYGRSPSTSTCITELDVLSRLIREVVAEDTGARTLAISIIGPISSPPPMPSNALVTPMRKEVTGISTLCLAQSMSPSAVACGLRDWRSAR
eukprot:CAMPEP_0173186928 /NCGR_PEP_ID=MMETSP1141-20130122/10413_1 /TAXON_ID=483371 /ORGANISM="non described non described, Strain CCMP2298" /LENGTH=128 /DNA_ID=CAMNT_0014110683 /DNA_START=212 /DNA_END=598 /DNA_ORIENTATION=+